MHVDTTDFVDELAAGAAAGKVRGAGRTRLIHAAAVVIDESGYVAASVAAIAERAGMATGALYRHFPSKADLFVELFRRAADHQLDAMRRAAAGHERWLDKLDAVIGSYAASALARPRLAWALVYEPVDPLVDAERLTSRRRYCDEMAALIRLAIDAGELPDQDPAVSAAGIVGALAEALANPLSTAPADELPHEELVQPITRFCRRALGAPVS